MKVLNLCCAHDHRFEGWFGSDGDFSSQCERGLVACPICDDNTITRLPSAPRLNVTTQRGDAGAPVTMNASMHADSPQAQQARMLQAVRDLMEKTEDVGDRFPEEARRIHYGEAEERGIRGRATREDAEALRDEGIEVVTVKLPVKATIQ